MTPAAKLLEDAFGRVRETVHDSVGGLDGDRLCRRLDPDANSIAWLVWHLTRIQDDHVADLAERDQAWLVGGWAERFGLSLPERDHGFGHGRDEVAAVRAEADLLIGYHDAVHAGTVEFLATLADADLDRVVDADWDPPVTLGVRLVSVLDDDAQHAGQAAFLRGVLDRAG